MAYLITAYSCQAIQHVPSFKERVKALRNINRLLKTNGPLVLTVYNWESDAKNLKCKEGFYGVGGPLDLWRAAFTENDLRELLEKSGFKTQLVRGIFNIPKRIMRRLPGSLYFLDLYLSNFKFSIKTGKHLIAKAVKIRELDAYEIVH